jgi:hypothetical protein
MTDSENSKKAGSNSDGGKGPSDESSDEDNGTPAYIKATKSAQIDVDPEEVDEFSAATEVEDPDDYRELNIDKAPEGWELEYRSPDRLIWLSETSEKYAVELRGPNEVVVHSPPNGESGEDYNPQSKLTERKELGEYEDPSNGLEKAVNWMEEHRIEFEDDLTEFHGIGEKTAEYLCLEHGARTHKDLLQLHEEGILSSVVSSHYHEEIEQQLSEF